MEESNKEKEPTIKSNVPVDNPSNDVYSDNTFVEEDIDQRWERLNVGLFKNVYNRNYN